LNRFSLKAVKHHDRSCIKSATWKRLTLCCLPFFKSTQPGSDS